jgi:hypothetical protein
MKYFLVLIFSYLSILFVFSSCDKKCYDDYEWGDDGLCPDAEQSFEDMKAWYFFKEGTYWIYQEQSTGIIDTLTVIYTEEGEDESGGSFSWTAGSPKLNGVTQSVDENTSEFCNEKEGCICYKVYTARVFSGNGILEEFGQMYPHYAGNWIDNNWGNARSTVVSVKNHLEFGDFLFYNVVEFQSIHDTFNNYFVLNTKYAKNVGMIEMKISDFEDWKLIGYHVVQ